MRTALVAMLAGMVLPSCVAAAEPAAEPPGKSLPDYCSAFIMLNDDPMSRILEWRPKVKSLLFSEHSKFSFDMEQFGPGMAKVIFTVPAFPAVFRRVEVRFLMQDGELIDLFSPDDEANPHGKVVLYVGTTAFEEDAVQSLATKRVQRVRLTADSWDVVDDTLSPDAAMNFHGIFRCLVLAPIPPPK